MAESKAERAARARRIVAALERAYPGVTTALRFATPFELLVATILSAQCTDERVNQVTLGLFAHYPDAAALAQADPAQLEEEVRPTGFYRQKAKSIQSAARDLVERFGGEVPPRLEDLVTLRGVARKTANVVLGNAYGIPGLAIDTHMARVNRRLGLTRSSEPDRVEADLAALVPQKSWTRYTNRVIHHGRVVCQARKPRCGACVLAKDCPKVGVPRAQRSAA